MSILYKNKPVLILARGCNLGDEAVLNNIWETKNWTFRQSYTYNLYTCTAKDIKNKIDSLKAPLTPNAVLYFSSSSEFPRFKLGDSGFKRCIKVEKADFVIVGTIGYHEEKNCLLLEDEQYIYYIPKDDMYFSYRCDQTKVNAFKLDPEKYIRNRHIYYGSTLTKIYEGSICYAQSDSADIERLMDGTYKKLVTDKELDTAINGNFDTLDSESMSSICDMLDSPDKVTQGVGLKILMGYNVQATPLAVRTMLGLRERLSACSEWKGVGVQQVLSSIGWRGFGRFPEQLYYILPKDNEIDSYTEEDKNLVKDLYKRAADYYMREAMNTVNQTGIPKLFGWEVSYDIAEK